jgi:hypothetical protein
MKERFTCRINVVRLAVAVVLLREAELLLVDAHPLAGELLAVVAHKLLGL